MCLWNRFIHTYNYDYERVTINGAQVHYEPDGSWAIVVAATDPGPPQLGVHRRPPAGTGLVPLVPTRCHARPATVEVVPVGHPVARGDRGRLARRCPRGASERPGRCRRRFSLDDLPGRSPPPKAVRPGWSILSGVELAPIG